MKAWRRSEPRIARPFFAVNALEGALDGTVLLVGEREKEIEEDVVQLDPADFDDLHVAICPNLDAEMIRTTLGDRASGVALALILRDPMFKRRVMHQRWPVTGETPDRISLDASLVEEFGHKRELHATLALALDTDLNRLPGWPHRRGAWIAKRTFRLKLRSIKSTFSVAPMTREQAKKWTGFPDAAVYVELTSGSLLEELGPDDSFATCYVAEELFEAGWRTAHGPLVQSLLLPEIVTAMIQSAADDIAAAVEVRPGTPLAMITERLGENEPMSLMQLQSLIRDPIKLRAAVHDRTEFVKQLRSL